ncbi:3-dehydroquinate synthase [Catelliglobosispora koreensis]|uniref:3-dehydroquinate synthase n=1 Tax=Catelliglobosispora koreensis TaxID=129052 RepID=UPI00036711CB
MTTPLSPEEPVHHAHSATPGLPTATEQAASEPSVSVAAPSEPAASEPAASELAAASEGAGDLAAHERAFIAATSPAALATPAGQAPGAHHHAAHGHEGEPSEGAVGHSHGLHEAHAHEAHHHHTVVRVGGAQAYDVIIGEHISHHLPSLVQGATRAAVLFTASVNHDASHAVHELIGAGIEVTPITIPDAEAGKSVEVAARCWDTLAANGFTRSDVVIGVGGGALTDLAGFVASTWLRGVRWVPVATSVNGMVDAAVGGKTGINIAAGKNLVGAFYPPVGVLCELTALKTLPIAQRNAGLAEVVKCGFIADPVILELMSKPDSLPELIERSVRVKAEVVAEDLKESGRREILNYGHTLGHAIENVENYTWSHGQAISVGLVYAAILGKLTGRPDFVDQTREHLSALGLPVSYDGDWAALRAAMSIDKKARGNALRFVLLDDLAKPVTVPVQDESLLQRAYEGLRS